MWVFEPWFCNDEKASLVDEMPFMKIFAGLITNLFLTEDSVFRSLCDSEFYDLFSRYFDNISCLGISSFTSFALDKYTFS